MKKCEATIGSRIKGLIITYKLQQSEMSEFCCISQSHLSEQLNDKKPFNPEQILKIIIFINSKLSSEKHIDPNYIYGYYINR